MYIDFFYDIKKSNGDFFIPPWCIGEKQSFIDLLFNENLLTSTVLDIGSGDGHNAIAIRKKNLSVHGIERVPTAFNYCIENAKKNNIDSIFHKLDFFKDSFETVYNTVLDIAFFHGLRDIYVNEYLEKIKAISTIDSKLIIVTVNLTTEIKTSVLSEEYFESIKKLTGKDYKQDILLGSIHYSKDQVIHFFNKDWKINQFFETQYKLKSHDGKFYNTGANIFVFNKK